MTLEERLAKAEAKIISLENKLFDISENTEEKPKPPYTKFGGRNVSATTHPFDVRSQLGGRGGTIFWHDAEINSPAGTEPSTPSVGYHKHTHSRYSGGALIKNGLEIVEYKEGELSNIHSQQFLQSNPEIATEQNSQGQTIEKIGLLDLFFNPDTQTWGVATNELNVEKCFLVKRRTVANKDGNGDPITGEDIGDIEKDENGNEMKSPLYVVDANGNFDITNSSVIWDKNARGGLGTFRFLATYAYSPEEE